MKSKSRLGLTQLALDTDGMSEVSLDQNASDAPTPRERALTPGALDRSLGGDVRIHIAGDGRIPDTLGVRIAASAIGGASRTYDAKYVCISGWSARQTKTQLDEWSEDFASAATGSPFHRIRRVTRSLTADSDLASSASTPGAFAAAPRGGPWELSVTLCRCHVAGCRAGPGCEAPHRVAVNLGPDSEKGRILVGYAAEITGEIPKVATYRKKNAMFILRSRTASRELFDVFVFGLDQNDTKITWSHMLRTEDQDQRARLLRTEWAGNSNVKTIITNEKAKSAGRVRRWLKRLLWR